MEYEYSFEVDSFNKYVDYCRRHKYTLVEQAKETRIIFRKENKTMARITIKEDGNGVTKFLDFKEDKLSDDVLIERRESKKLAFENDDEVLYILDFLGYKEDNQLIRNRTIYTKKGVKFELDEYIEPTKTMVVAIEGNKKEVDIVYDEIKCYHFNE
jgi:adenylate cyclase class IV